MGSGEHRTPRERPQWSTAVGTRELCSAGDTADGFREETTLSVCQEDRQPGVQTQAPRSTETHLCLCATGFAAPGPDPGSARGERDKPARNPRISLASRLQLDGPPCVQTRLSAVLRARRPRALVFAGRQKPQPCRRGVCSLNLPEALGRQEALLHLHIQPGAGAQDQGPDDNGTWLETRPSVSAPPAMPPPLPPSRNTGGCCQPSNGPESEESGYKYILKLTCCLVSAWIFLLLTRRVFLISGFSGILPSGGFLPSAPPMPVPSEPGSDPSRRPPAGGREKPAEPWAPGLLAPRLWAEFPRALPTSPRLSLPPG